MSGKTTPPIYTRDQAKAYAHAIRAEAEARGARLSHSAALERVATELGYRDWNTAAARLSNAPLTPLQVGDRVAGSYLKQPSTGMCSRCARSPMARLIA